MIETGFHYYPARAQASSSWENFIPVRERGISTYSLCSHGSIGWLCVVSPFFCSVLEYSRQNRIRQKLVLVWPQLSQTEPEGCWTTAVPADPSLCKESSVLLYSAKPTPPPQKKKKKLAAQRFRISSFYVRWKQEPENSFNNIYCWPFLFKYPHASTEFSTRMIFNQVVLNKFQSQKAISFSYFPSVYMVLTDVEMDLRGKYIAIPPIHFN